ncbi:MAG TPA: helix-turn-helix domain-containing protein [Steroidobacteraceae bacterium]|nr:helix-turn-helix domain-containing protein [Steroidobacteraceae bacterium]
MSGFAAIALENVYMSSLGIFLDAFELVRGQVTRRFATRARFAMESPIRLLTPNGRAVRVAGGRRMSADAGLDEDARYALIHIPGFVVGSEEALDARLADATRLCEWLRRQYQGGALISASGSAVFVLAHAELLKAGVAALGRPLIPLFRRRFPAIRVDHRRPLVEQRRMITATGLAADAQLLSRLLELVTTAELSRWFGDVAGLNQIAEDQLAQDELVARAQLWLEDRVAQPLRIAELANAMAVSQQTLLRHFRRHLAMTPRDYVRKIRMEAAQQLLLRTTRPVQQIAGLVGYEDTHAFAKVFRRFAGVSAQRFRTAGK